MYALAHISLSLFMLYLLDRILGLMSSLDDDFVGEHSGHTPLVGRSRTSNIMEKEAERVPTASADQQVRCQVNVGLSFNLIKLSVYVVVNAVCEDIILGRICYDTLLCASRTAEFLRR